MNRGDSTKHQKFLDEAYKEAVKGLKEGGIPIGSVLVKKGKIIGRGHNRRVQKKSAILHAEMDCLENAGRLTAKDYSQCVLYSTLSPCEMCSGAIKLYKIPLVIIGESANFRGPEDYMRCYILDDQNCYKLLKGFIAENPKLWNEDIGEKENENNV